MAPTAPWRMGTFLMLYLLLICFSARTGVCRSAAAQPTASTHHYDTESASSSESLQKLAKATEAWRQVHEEALNRVFSHPIVSGALTGDSWEEAVHEASSSPHERRVGVSDSSNDDAVLASRVSGRIMQLKNRAVQIVRVVGTSQATHRDKEQNGEVVGADAHAAAVFGRSLNSLRQASVIGSAVGMAITNTASERAADTAEAGVGTFSDKHAGRSAVKESIVVIPNDGPMSTGRSVHVPLTVVGESYNVVQFTGYKGNTLSSILQLRSRQYDSRVRENNCEGMYINVEMRNNWRPLSALPNEENSTATVSASTDSVWSQLWDPIVQLFDISIFCQVVSSLSMRIDNVPYTEPFYIVVKSGISASAFYDYASSDTDFSCQMDVFVSQASTKREKVLHTVFALVLPLIALLVPLPFTLWRSDIIQQLIGDVDFGEWLWFIPYYLRYVIIKGAVSAYNAVYEWRLERRTQATQRALEARHQALMREAGGSAHTLDTTTAHAHTAAVETAPKSDPPLVDQEGGLPHFGRLRDSDADDASLRPRAPGLRTGARELSTTDDASHLRAVAVTAAPTGLNSSETRPSVAQHGQRPTAEMVDPVDRMERFNQPAGVAAQRREGEDETYRHADDRHDDYAPSSAPDQVEGDLSSPTRAGPGRQRGAASGRAYLFTTVTGDDTTAHHVEHKSDNNHSANESIPIVVSDSSVVPILVADERGAAEPDFASPATAPQAPPVPREVAAQYAEEDEEKFCRICRDGEEMEPLITPCQCTGSVRWIHRSCLDHWRLESAKRNLTNVNNCEICKQPFTINIKRSTLLWESSRQFIRTSILVFTSIVVFILIVTLSHSIIGELSCTGTNHRVAYSTMFSFQGMIVSVFNYSLIVFMVMFAHLIVYSWFRGRPDVEEYVNETHMIPPFWTRWNALRIVCVSAVLCVQAISMGFLLKYIFYATSNMVWNWELSPFLGSTCLMFFYSCMMTPIEGIRHCVHRARDARRRGRAVSAEDVVVDATEADAVPASAAQTATGAAETAPRTTASAPFRPDVDATDVDFTRQLELPPEQRVIRAMEYCPPRRTAPRA